MFSALLALTFVAAASSVQTKHSTPTKLLAEDQWPEFADDLDFENMELALERQIVRFGQMNLSVGVKFGNRRYTIKDQLQAAQMFLAITRQARQCLTTQQDANDCYTAVNAQIREKFAVYVPNTSEKAFFTAYYTPTLVGSALPNEENFVGVFQKPKTRTLQQLTREEIDFEGKLDGKSLSLGYFPDRLDQFLLHVQGGGKLIVDGEPFYISYDGTNEQRFTFICKYMQAQGYIDDCSIKKQRAFLNANPDKHRAIFSSSPSYVWFKKTIDPPLGNDGVSLTDYRSLAQDSTLYHHKGTLAFVKTVKPIPKPGTDDLERLQEYSRFFIDQDTGGAIKGPARADLYFGEGEDAAFVAYNMKYEGDIFFLMPK